MYKQQIAAGLNLKRISAQQLFDRLKKSVITLENHQHLSFSCFENLSCDRVISADKMTNRAKGSVWHKKQKDKVTFCRQHMDKSQKRRQMIVDMHQLRHIQIYIERNYRGEPMQGPVKEIFDLNRCWMKGSNSNRWLFAAMGLTVQMHQLIAYRSQKSTWQINEQVLGQKLPNPSFI